MHLPLALLADFVLRFDHSVGQCVPNDERTRLINLLPAGLRYFAAEMPAQFADDLFFHSVFAVCCHVFSNLQTCPRVGQIFQGAQVRDRKPLPRTLIAKFPYTER